MTLFGRTGCPLSTSEALAVTRLGSVSDVFWFSWSRVVHCLTFRRTSVCQCSGLETFSHRTALAVPNKVHILRGLGEIFLHPACTTIHS